MPGLLLLSLPSPSPRKPVNQHGPRWGIQSTCSWSLIFCSSRVTGVPPAGRHRQHHARAVAIPCSGAWIFPLGGQVQGETNASGMCPHMCMGRMCLQCVWEYIQGIFQDRHWLPPRRKLGTKSAWICEYLSNMLRDKAGYKMYVKYYLKAVRQK